MNEITTRMDHLSWLDYQQRIADPQTVVLLPVGALEQHGPHLPLGTDALLATAVAHDAAQSIQGLVAPPLNYGYKSQPKCGGGQHFPGTTSLDAQTLIAQTCDIVCELARHGVRQIVIVSGHYENQWFLIEGIDLALRRIASSLSLPYQVRVMRLEYWDFLTAETLANVFPYGFPGFALEHAAVIETSLMLHYHPHLVKLDCLPADPDCQFPPYDVYPTCQHWVPASGVLSSARGADQHKGRLMAEEVAKLVAQAIKKVFMET